ncbi:MAG: DsbA family protein [Halioglobus sp.]
MSEQSNGRFKEQGGVATMDPSRFLRWATSRLMTKMSAESRLRKVRAKLESARQKKGEPHRVEYFHQVDDGYSHLAAQLLKQLSTRYDIELQCHLVTGATGDNSPEPELLARLSRYEAHLVAPSYNLSFPDHPQEPSAKSVKAAAQILAGLDNAAFIENAAAVGAALWSTLPDRMTALADEFNPVSADAAEQRTAQGSARRAELKHYSGAMFYYAGEWYWGVDRLYHLEQRLSELGADRTPGEPLIAPRPETPLGPAKDNGSLTLEVYPSLRSPYTAISFDRAVDLARKTGVTLSIRPVLPMVMRGVPATRQKGIYIFTDTAREARAAGVPYGNFYDPIGEPVRRAYSLYPWAREQGKENDLISAFLRCAFANGINTNKESGLQTVVTEAGLDWQEAQQHLGSTGWEAELEANRKAMYDAGLWGVPSFRLLDAQGNQKLAIWGQDRLWLVAKTIQAELAGAA